MTTNQNYKPSEGKREEFRKYLEKNGVMDALTKVLVNLYEEIDKPEDALAFIRDKLAIQAGLETYDQLTEKIRSAETRIKELEESVANISASTGEQLEEPGDVSKEETEVQDGVPTEEGESEAPPEDPQ